ncbi:MAG: hypothetical protein SVG88_06860 [Halobacteriales archaeon]|nr:hypothetical protein [Halobacteriales archaeon]
MNSSRCFSLAAFLVVLVLASGAAGAVTISSGGAPNEAQVGQTVTSTFTLTELYQNPNYQQWTLQGQTDLANVTWTVQTLNQAGEVVDTQSYNGGRFNHQISIENDVAEVRVKITGEVPEITNYSYSPQEQFLFAGFIQVRQGGTSNQINVYQTHHFTPDSKKARQAIRSAQRAIQQAGGNQEAQTIVDNAISAYEAGNFQNAIDLANQARQRAEQAQQSQQRTQLLLMAGGGILVVLLIIGGIFWYRSQQTGSKL